MLQTRPGDYVSGVAGRFRLPVEGLLQQNVDRIGALGDYLPPGQRLMICGIPTSVNCRMVSKPHVSEHNI